MLYFLLMQIPGLPAQTIPGVTSDYVPTQFAAQAVEVYTRMRSASILLLGVIAVISCGVHLFDLFGNHFNPHEVWQKVLVAFILISIYPYVFYVPMALSHGVAHVIFSDDDTRALNRKFREAAEQEQNQEGTNEAQQSWFVQLGLLAALLNPGQALLTELFLGIVTIFFYVTALLVGLFWRLLVSILFCFGPLLVALGAVVKIGGRIQGAWLCALIQISLWQAWLAVCSFMVNTADGLFQPQLQYFSTGEVNATNHFESIAVALAFTVLYWLGPMMIAWLIPISRASSAFGEMYMGATNRAIQLGALAAYGLGKAGAALGQMGGAGAGGGGRTVSVPSTDGVSAGGASPVSAMGMSLLPESPAAAGAMSGGGSPPPSLSPPAGRPAPVLPGGSGGGSIMPSDATIIGEIVFPAELGGGSRPPALPANGNGATATAHPRLPAPPRLLGDGHHRGEAE